MINSPLNHHVASLNTIKSTLNLIKSPSNHHKIPRDSQNITHLQVSQDGHFHVDQLAHALVVPRPCYAELHGKIMALPQDGAVDSVKRNAWPKSG